MTPQQLIAEVRSRLAKATPHPWKYEPANISVYPDQERGAMTKWKRVLTLADREIDSEVPANGRLIARAPEDLALLTDALEVALEKLAEVQSKVGMCIYGSSDTSHDPEVAYRQGSYQAWCDTGSIAKEALIDITELIAKRGKS